MAARLMCVLSQASRDTIVKSLLMSHCSKMKFVTWPSLHARRKFFCHKHDLTHLSLEEQFILRVFEYRGAFGAVRFNLKVLAAKLSYLMQEGCQPQELVICCNVLKLSQEVLTSCIERLRSLGFKYINMPLIYYASKVKYDIDIYELPQRNKCMVLWKIAQLADVLQCSDAQMMKILAFNPRLVGRRGLDQSIAKAKCLISNGAAVEDIRNNSNILNNKAMKVIESRAKQLSELGYNLPLDIRLIGRNSKAYSDIVTRLEKWHAKCPSASIAAANDIIKQLPPMSPKQLSHCRPHIEYLLSVGFAPADILAYPTILEVTLDQLHCVLSDHLNYHIGDVSLPMCHSIISRNSRRQKSRESLVNFQAVNSLMLPRNALKHLDRSIMLHNFTFLEQCGFTNSDITAVPLVLLHSVDVVMQHWKIVADKNNEATTAHVFRKYVNDPIKQLNILQYSIERATNFRQAYVASNNIQPEVDTEYS